MGRGVAVLLVLVLSASFMAVARPAASSAQPTENTWTTKAPMPQAVPGCKAAVLSGKIYVMGGSANYEYDPATDSWTAKKPMRTPRQYFGIAVYDNKIYTIGGRNWISENNVYYSVNEVYDPSTDSWETKHPMPTARGSLEANVVDGKIYMMGGRTGDQKTTVALNEVYDVASDSWTTKEPIPYPVVAYASAVVDGKIYILGGQDEYLPATLNVDYNQIYNTRTDSWSQGAPLPTTVLNAAAGATTGVFAPKRIYLIGGEADRSIAGTGINQIYNPENNTWKNGASMPTARGWLTVAVLDDTLYAIGGAPGLMLPFLTSNEQYLPVGYGTPDASYLLNFTPPKVSLLSPLNQTYNESGVPLIFTLDKQTNWTGYSLDGEKNVTISGNCTITDLTNGLHSITVYANDTFGNTGVSETVYFSVKVEKSFPSLPFAASVASVTLLGAGVLIYLRKRKRTRTS
jgi:N-acetylneuraminic acid mutarotase